MDQPPEETASAPMREPRHHTYLRWLVTALTAVMIIGLIVIITLIALIFLRDPPKEEPPVPAPAGAGLPAKISVPEGETVISVTQGPDWSALVTRDAEGRDRLHLFSPESGAIYRTIIIDE